ncbi:MAG TPA: M23 family metallopeptidase [Ardenticatenaceae bacterium]|nr:M23 family metallopeptidase [Ardenticatenaceae bacterium]
MRVLVLIAFLASALAAPVAAQETASPPFRLPFAEPPGPTSWLVGQMYGNTTGAYFQRDTTYRFGQGVHFGIDFNAACGTPVVAIGDGIVNQVDGPHGSPPHNVMIHHANGYASFYGHLLERANLQIGQVVRAGEVIALSGDFYNTCRSAPHHHLEIRYLSHTVAYNPVPLIAADWDSLLLYAGGGSTFQRDLDVPRRWQAIADQPQVSFGGALLNEYANPWPRDFRR